MSEQSLPTLTGTPVVAGVVHAPAVWAAPRPTLPAAVTPVAEGEREAEAARVDAAVEAVASRLEERAGRASGAAAEVLTATAGLARDKGWRKAARKAITSGDDAASATVTAIEQFVVTFEKLGGLMAERVTDLRDIRDRVVAELTGQSEPGVPRPQEPSVLLADDLAPADTAELDPERIVALVTSLGGPTSHTSIIARQLGLPCIVAVRGLEAVPAGELLLVDGAAGTLTPGVAAEQAQALVEASAAERALTESWQGPGATADGHPVDLLANVGNPDAARQAAQASPAQGVGLFRTELLFLDARTEPDVDEQRALYAGVLEAFAGRKVVTRTLDAGSDKPLAFATMPDEPNPALGVRGVRLAQNDPGLLTRQLDALAAARHEVGAAEADVWVMAPMIATVEEARSFAGQARSRDLRAGVMVEVPAVALLADEVLAEVDFVSIGTNDLTQYVMAADRMAPELAALTDPWQPAVLRLVALVGEAGQRAGKPVGVCGEAAADPLLACVLVGLGVTSLSMAAGSIRGVGARLGQVTLEQCRAAARAALGADSPAGAREAASVALG